MTTSITMLFSIPTLKRLAAYLLMIAMVLSTFATNVLVAAAASTGVTTSDTALSTTVGEQVNFIVSVVMDDASTTPGTYISVTDDSDTGGMFDGTLGGECNDATPDGDEQFSIDQNKGVCYSNSAAGVYTITVQLLDGPGGDPIGDPATIEVIIEADEPEACDPQTNVDESTNIQNASTSEYFATVGDALADCDTTDGDTIALLGDIETEEQITIDRPMTLDGNGFTIAPVFAKSDDSHNSAITILADDVTIMDTTINGAGGTNLHGIHAYESVGVTIANVTISDINRTALLVNGSTVTVSDLTTSGSGWHAINVDQGSGVTDPAVLNIENTSVHNETSPFPTPHIFLDDVAKDVSVNDIDEQYDYSTTTFEEHEAGIYTLKTPVEPEPEYTETTNTITVSGDTAAGENQSGWLFNRDDVNATAFEFSTTTNSIGDGSLYVLPIGTTTPAHKFIGEYFALSPIADIDSFTYDFQIGAGGSTTDAGQFYLNVYANYGTSSADNYYDCKYDVVPESGSLGGFTTVSFDPTQDYPVTTSGSSPFACPSVPAEMDEQSTGSIIRAFAINLGDTSASDEGLDGYFDNAVFTTTDEEALEITTTIFDFDPVTEPVVEDDDDDDNGSNSGGTRVGVRRSSAPRGEVLGASTDDAPQCFDNGGPGIYLYDYMRIGSNSSAWEIMKLQIFLTAQGFYTPATGVFDLTTDQNVRLFQTKETEAVLMPWVNAGLMDVPLATGYVYLTTRARINNLVCPGSETTPTLR